MKAPQAPHLDERRTEEFAAELRERAQAWIPGWALADGEHDFGQGLLQIAARFSSDVAEHLDGAGDKMRRGFLDWLGIPRIAARPARLPVVLKLVDAATEAVPALAPVRMQADAAGASVVFETEQDVRVVPGRLEAIVSVDADQDAYYLPPPGLSDLQPAEALPTQWRLKSFTSAGATKLQLDPELGLAEKMILVANRQQYRIVKLDKDLVTIEPPLVTELAGSTPVSKLTTFSPFGEDPFGGKAHNWQEHALYLGDDELLNIESEATIEIVGAIELREGYTWEYSGKRNPNDEVGWLPLTLDADRQKTVNNAIVLMKPKGAIEKKEIGGKNTRWIRVYAKTIDPASSPFTSDRLAIRVNSFGCNETLPCPPVTTTVSLTAEAMANTTPLVLDNVFYPLGKEPRQFDAFYLGSQEAFSKKTANVQVCFEMADRTFSALAAVREGDFAETVLAGVAKDRSLHLHSLNPTTGAIDRFRDRGPLQPPQPGFLGNAEAGNTVALDAQPPWQLPVWSEPDPPPYASAAGFLVGTSDGDSIWIWHEHSADSQRSGWISYGKLPPASSTANTNAAVDGLVYLAGQAGAASALVALRGGELYTREWPNGPQWGKVDTGGVTLKSIVPILVVDASGRLKTSTSAGMVGIDDQDKLFLVDTNGTCKPVTPVPANVKFDTRIRPVAIKSATELNVAAVTASDPPQLVATKVTTSTQKVTLNDTKILAALEAVLVNGTAFHVLATVRDSSGKHLITWAPFETPPEDHVFKSPALGGGLMEGAPVVAGRFVVVPGGRADIFVSEFDLSLRLLKSANVEIGVVVPDSIPVLAANDLIVRLRHNPEEPVKQVIIMPPGLAQVGFPKDGDVFYEIDHPTDPNFLGATGLYAYHLSALLTGSFTDPKLTLATTDDKTDVGDWLWIHDDFFRVDSITPPSQVPRVATLATPNSNGKVPQQGQCKYVRPINTGGRVAHFMRLDLSTGGSGDWDAKLLPRIRLVFPGQSPQEQFAKAFFTDKVAGIDKPQIVVLGEQFQVLPANPVKFLVDAAFDEWQRDDDDTATNPELSWEYWNGKGWWTLNAKRDETQNLRTTGAVEFEVPSDIASSDWSGKTNFWIRARLVGGDYGREKVTAKTKTLPDGSTEQTIERSSEGIHAPAVVKLHISYAICTEVQPTYLIAQDSGSYRDQSDANRTAGAIVQAFVPLALTLGRLAQGAAPRPTPGDCPPECADPLRPTAAAQPLAGAVAVPASQPATGRAIFIGVAGVRPQSPAKVLFGEPVNVLMLVDERKHTSLAPMAIDALVADHFDPIVANDTTRALSESGLLSMAFAEAPTPRELFGQTLTWLRLTPKAGANAADWNPSLRGAYLNAVWASATETLTRELLGSSDGAPNMSVRLARPPVLDHTLELRVKEPLGDEERAALRKVDKASVLNGVDGLPGDWVLWKQVADPNDEPADARVYALDEATGEIRFGDGRHGRIPPIGRDAIVAFSYKRTELGSSGSTTIPGNNIAARTPLNLVSPVATVESVTAADQAAGGAPPEDDNRVLRFGFSRLRHRGRAVTLHDLEDLAAQSSPDIVQARAVALRDSIRLVVVMKGRNPSPTVAQVRELRRLLLAAAPVSLSAPNALRIEDPGIRQLRIQLQLRVETLDHAGALGKYVRERIVDFFNTATGGIDRDGWALGLSPSADDIAFALIDAPHLDSIEDVTLYEIALDGSQQPWSGATKPTDLVMLHDDWLRVQFETAEVEQ